MYKVMEVLLNTRWRWVISLTLLPLYNQGISLLYPLYRRWDGPRTSLDIMVKEKIYYVCQEANPDFLIIQHVAWLLYQCSYLRVWNTFYNFFVSLWSSGQSSWLQIQRSWFDSWRYQFFWEVSGLERSPLSVVSTVGELLGRKSSGSGLENREYGHEDRLYWPRDTPPANVGANFADKRRSLSQHTSLTNSDHGICFLLGHW
jgi:hypothetical protein